jgi:DNA polymerase IV
MEPFPARHILHLDMDAFFASVEVLDRPELRGLPVVVGGADRGVVCAASYEARNYGIRSALPMAMARKLCPQAVFLPVRMARYQEVSVQILEIFHRFTPLVEPLSLDEAFLDVGASQRLHGPAAEIAGQIRKLVRETLNLTVSAGVASSKLVAKIASDCNKPDGLTVVAAGREKEFLAPLPIDRLWGVGATTRESLALMGVRTIGDLARLPLPLLVARFGTSHGEHLHLTAQAVDTRAVEPERQTKSIGNEETFADDVRDLRRLEEELLALCLRVGRRTRRHGSHGRTVTVKVKYHDFQQVTRSATLRAAIDDDRTLYGIALELLAKTEAGTRPVRLLGLTLSALCPAGHGQPDLFGKQQTREKHRDLCRAMDTISDRFGSDSLVPARLLTGIRR